jgi:integrase
MAQQDGYIFRAGKWWYLRYRENVVEDGQLIRKQKCVQLARVSDRYRSKGDLADLVAEKLSNVREADKCPHSSDSFIDYVEQVYLPFVKKAKKASTYAAYKAYFEHYIKPRVGKYALRDFTVAIVASLLKEILGAHKLNRKTITKTRSIVSGIFTYAMSEGHFPGRSAAENPASRARIPETATEPGKPKAATRDEVKAILAAFSDMPLERAAVGIISMTGVRPGEARGLKWEDWDRVNAQFWIERSVWQSIEGGTKTLGSERFVTVSPELREILLALWKSQGSPISGYILAGRRAGHPANLNNLAKRSIRRRLKQLGLAWPTWYALRRFHGTAVRAQSNLETTSRALGNSPDVADRHYVKPSEVLPDVRKAVNDAVSGLIH